MKKSYRILLIAILIFTITISIGVFTACDIINSSNYIVYFESNGGSEVSPRMCVKGESVLTSPVSVKSNYSFLGWFENKRLSGEPVEFPYTPKKTLTLYAGWENGSTTDLTYTVTFVENGGFVVSGNLVQTVIAGQGAYEPTLKRYGYTYTWDKTFNNITEDIVVSAVWTQNTAEKNITVSFNLNGGKLISGNNLQIIKKGTSVKAPEVKKAGYILSWDKAFDNITQDTVINAVWTVAENYTVTFKVNGGSLVSGQLVQSVKHGNDAVPPVIGKSGYLLSWDKSYKNITANIEINAVWLSNSTNPITVLSLGSYLDVVYDEAYGKIVVLREYSLDIYNAASVQKEKTFTFLNSAKCIDTDNGIVAVGFGSAMQIKLYDLSDNNVLKTELTSIPVSYLVMDGDNVIYTEYDQWCDIYIYNISSESNTYIGYSYQPRLAINRQDHILYYCETGLSSSDITYRSSQNGEFLYESDFSQYEYNYTQVYFDGKYVHYYGKTLDRFDGSTVSQNELVRSYAGLSGYTKTILESEILGLISSSSKVSLYDNINNRVIYTFDISANSANYIGEGKYFLKGANSAMFIDTTFIEGAYTGDIYSFGKQDEISISDDGKVTGLKVSTYTNAVFDENYIYILYKNKFSVQIYDIATFELIKSISFLEKPECMDAASGILAIGTGESMLMYVFNTNDWSYEILSVSTNVYSVLIYEDSVIYAPYDQWCDIYVYNLQSKKNNLLQRSMYCVSMAINREDGILYLGERNLSSCNLIYYNLKTNLIIYKSPFSTFQYNSASIAFSGSFVRYAGKTFEKNMAVQISENQKARKYLGVGEYTNISTIYDDGDVSIFTANMDGDYYTIFYDITSDSILYRLKAQTTKATKHAQDFVLSKAGGDMVFSISL